jgi:hypothetical protein
MCESEREREREMEGQRERGEEKEKLRTVFWKNRTVSSSAYACPCCCKSCSYLQDQVRL